MPVCVVSWCSYLDFALGRSRLNIEVSLTTCLYACGPHRMKAGERWRGEGRVVGRGGGKGGGGKGVGERWRGRGVWWAEVEGLWVEGSRSVDLYNHISSL